MSKNSCVLPWKHMALGAENGKPTVLPCCRFKAFGESEFKEYKFLPPEEAVNHPEYFQKIRDKMKAGEKLPECVKCWEEEKLGGRNMRMHFNQLYGYIEDKFELDYLEVFLSNHCNLACRMCNVDESTTWARLYNAAWKDAPRTDSMMHHVPDHYYNQGAKVKPEVNTVRDFDLTKFNKPTMIKILGGEPFMSPEHSPFLQDLAKYDDLSDVSIVYHTNATKFPTKEDIEVWKKCKSVELCFSIDGYGYGNDYNRTLSNWNEIEENVKKYLDLDANLIFSVHSCLSVFSIWSFNELSKWVQSIIHKDKHSIDCIRWPEYTSIGTMPEEYKQHLIDKMETWDNVQPFHKRAIMQGLKGGETDLELWNELLERSAEMDAVTGLDYKKVLPIDNKGNLC